MDAVPLHRVAVVLPFANFLADVGASVERGFRHSGLPVCALENADNFVPSHRFWDFLIHMTRSQDIPDLGFRVGQRFGANCADPHLTDLLGRAPTLFQGLLRASHLTNKTVSHCQVGIRQPPRSPYVYFYHSPSCDVQNPSIEQIGWYGIMTLIGMVREFLGRDWLPSEIGVMPDHPPLRNIREQFPDTPIRLSQPYSYVALEKELLSVSPLHPRGPERRFAGFRGEVLATDLVGSVKQLLQSYMQEDDLSIEFAAGFCDMSKRSLQRKLRARGRRYSALLSEVRFDVARRMLQDPACQVTEVSQLLGYSDPTHFARAFRRIAGISPRMYRQAYQH